MKEGEIMKCYIYIYIFIYIYISISRNNIIQMTIERGRDTYGKQREMAIAREREIHIANTEREMSPEAALRKPVCST